MWCWEHFQALPLFIETKFEEEFIVNHILQRMNAQQGGEFEKKVLQFQSES